MFFKEKSLNETWKCSSISVRKMTAVKYIIPLNSEFFVKLILLFFKFNLKIEPEIAFFGMGADMKT